MPPKSRGNAVPAGLQSKSTPSLPTLPSPEAAGYNGSSASSRLRPLASTLDGALEDGDADSLSSASLDSEEEDEKLPARRPLHISRSHTHLPRQTASALYPPFYNRPPTPLPPSPSLTSLLLPSRRTTPDSSDVDQPSTSLTSSTTTLVKSARHAPRIPRAAPKVPTYEYYGFALYLGSSAAFLMYILWAYVPAPVLHSMGIWYYPDRWWALAIPCWLIALIIYIYVALASWNTEHLTLEMARIECLVDECAQVGVVDRRTREIVGNVGDGKKGDYERFRFGVGEEVDWKSFWSTGTDAVLDVPIGGVCEILYGEED